MSGSDPFDLSHWHEREAVRFVAVLMAGDLKDARSLLIASL